MGILDGIRDALLVEEEDGNGGRRTDGRQRYWGRAMLSRRAPEGVDGGWDESNVIGGAWDNYGGYGKVRVRTGGIVAGGHLTVKLIWRAYHFGSGGRQRDAYQ